MGQIKRIFARLERHLWARRAYKLVLDELAGLPDLAAASALLAGMRPPRGLVPLQFGPPAGKRVLVLAAHPNDESIGIGGTLAGAVAGGSRIEIVFVTSGRLDRWLRPAPMALRLWLAEQRLRRGRVL